jgi:hypothetical protein
MDAHTANRFKARREAEQRLESGIYARLDTQARRRRACREGEHFDDGDGYCIDCGKRKVVA